MKSKRKFAVLIPHYFDAGKTFVFLQKRTKDAKVAPEQFGLFGGSVEEGETIEEALKREIKEELVYDVRNYVLFERIEFPDYISYVYKMQVTKDFEKEVRVLEGDYGKWLNEEEVNTELLVYEGTKIILNKFFASLRK